MPDGENDLFFADRAIEGMISAGLESQSISGMFDVLRGYGFVAPMPFDRRLSSLVANVYNDMPSWENNGWSPIELTERLTGKKIFRTEDGGMKRPGRNDPCPCGSGRKYKRCCGR